MTDRRTDMRAGYQIGALWGFMTGGPVGAMIGGFWGDQWHRWLEAAIPRFQVRIGSDALNTDALFTAMGALTEGQLAAHRAEGLIRHIGQHLRLDDEQLRAGLSRYLAGTADTGQFDEQLERLAPGLIADVNQISLVASALLQAAYLCDTITPVMRTRLDRVRKVLGVPERVFRQWEQEIREHLGQSPRADALSEAWRTLGVTPGSDFETVRAAYRRLMSRYHPDKWARGTHAELADAHDRSQAIQQAYALLRRHLKH
ncbi:MAG: hypothetical protein D6758_01260 [Gammaproteobacteria bacterium]|nr:MAG: hypothetical protein D6758_01260 [Gammaproteobacteria bacterium]